MELFEEIRREYEFGVGSIKGVAADLKYTRPRFLAFSWVSTTTESYSRAEPANMHTLPGRSTRNRQYAHATWTIDTAFGAVDFNQGLLTLRYAGTICFPSE